MKLWIDSVTVARAGFRCCKNIDEAKEIINNYEVMSRVSGNKECYKIEEINMEDTPQKHKLLDWLSATKRNYIVCLHEVNTNETVD